MFEVMGYPFSPHSCKCCEIKLSEKALISTPPSISNSKKCNIMAATFQNDKLLKSSKLSLQIQY